MRVDPVGASRESMRCRREHLSGLSLPPPPTIVVGASAHVRYVIRCDVTRIILCPLATNWRQLVWVESVAPARASTIGARIVYGHPRNRCN